MLKTCVKPLAMKRAFILPSDFFLNIHLPIMGFQPFDRGTTSQTFLSFKDFISRSQALYQVECNSFHFPDMVKWCKTFTGFTLTSVQSDCGQEFMGCLQLFFSSFNHTMLEKAKAIMHHVCMPRIFWQDAAEVAIHLYNCQPMRRHSWKTPIEIFNEDLPDISYFKVFGTRAYVYIQPEQRDDKLALQAEEMIFIGYEPNMKAYCFWSTHQ